MPCSATLTAHGRSTSEALIADRQHPAWRGSCPHEVYTGTWTDPYTGQRRTVTNLIDPVQTRQIPIDRLAGAVDLSLNQAWRTRVCLLDLSSPGPVHAVDLAAEQSLRNSYYASSGDSGGGRRAGTAVATLARKTLDRLAASTSVVKMTGPRTTHRIRNWRRTPV